MEGKKVALVILDGWGIGDGSDSDGIAKAETPVYDRLMKDYPNARLKTFGKNVGLPEGQMGNSEVGHLNIGAGRIVFQDLVKINNAIDDGSFAANKELLAALRYADEKGVSVHFMGLTSEGGVHSSQSHLHALVDIAESECNAPTYVHAFTDGRDTPPKDADQCMNRLQKHLEGKRTKLVSMIGRYYAMDRDKRWERIKSAYDLLVHGVGDQCDDFAEKAMDFYDEGITDEFFSPAIIQSREGRVRAEDVVICFNFRTDRCRQITMALTQEEFPDWKMHTLPLYYVTMTRYDESFRSVHVLFEKDNLVNTLGETVANAGLSQLRIAETEKYPHVTFFFSGGREEKFENEQRVMVPSPKVATYDLQPEMSADDVCKNAVRYIANEQPDFICLNFANPDMVGHTGVFPAIVKAVEKTDECLGKVVEAALDKNYALIVIADHGNADQTQLPNGTPHTAHTKNLVPCIVIDKVEHKVKDGILADVAPTILQLMKVEQPSAMTGKSLVQ